MFFFFFKQKTAYEMRISDWSSDVCSSDLPDAFCLLSAFGRRHCGLWKLRRRKAGHQRSLCAIWWLLLQPKLWRLVDVRIGHSVAIGDLYALGWCSGRCELLRYDADPVSNLLNADMHGRSTLPFPLWFEIGRAHV